MRHSIPNRHISVSYSQILTVILQRISAPRRKGAEYGCPAPGARFDARLRPLGRCWGARDVGAALRRPSDENNRVAQHAHAVREGAGGLKNMISAPASSRAMQIDVSKSPIPTSYGEVPSVFHLEDQITHTKHLKIV